MLQDRARDAIEEGGFEAIDFGAWDKGFDGRRFWLAFDGVAVRKEGATLDADYAVVFPFSVELRFERGRVTTGADADAIRFQGVDVQGNLSPFRRSIDIVGYGVSTEFGEDDQGEAICLFGTPCARPVRLDADPFERFSLHMDRSGRGARVSFLWQQRDTCSQVELSDLRVARGASLAEIGASLVADSLDGEAVMHSGHCGDGDAGSASDVEDEAWFDAAAVQRARWSERDRSIDELLQVLLVSVPEAYEYLVE